MPSNIKKIESVMGEWAPNNLAAIEAIELKSNEDDSGMDLFINALFQPRNADVSWPDFDKEMFRVSLKFDDVSNLHLKDFGGGSVQIMGFDIQFVGDRGMEGISYEITDYEDDRIRFSCAGVSIQSVSPAVHCS